MTYRRAYHPDWSDAEIVAEQTRWGEEIHCAFDQEFSARLYEEATHYLRIALSDDWPTRASLRHVAALQERAAEISERAIIKLRRLIYGDAPLDVFCTENGLRQDHQAEGWLCSPEGRRIVATCRAHAEIVIAEYREKLNQTWTFETAPNRREHGDGQC